MYFTREALEQATRARGRRPPGRPGRASPGRAVVDLTCGIGGDLVAFARAGLTTAGVDLDPLRVEMARANLAALGLGGAVDGRRRHHPRRRALRHGVRRPGAADRRAGRTFHVDDWTPPWTFVE